MIEKRSISGAVLYDKFLHWEHCDTKKNYIRSSMIR
jgi:hypothetical protein